MVYEELAGLGGWQKREAIAEAVAIRPDVNSAWIDRACCIGQRIQSSLLSNALNQLQNLGRVETTAGVSFRAIS